MVSAFDRVEIPMVRPRAGAQAPKAMVQPLKAFLRSKAQKEAQGDLEKKLTKESLRQLASEAPLQRRATKVNQESLKAKAAVQVAEEGHREKETAQDVSIAKEDLNMEGSPDVVTSEIENDERSSGSADQPWIDVISKNSQKRIAKAKLSVEMVRESVRKNSKGVFRVIFSKREEEMTEGGAPKFVSVPFKDGILGLCTSLHEKFPNVKPESRSGFIHVWVNTVEEVKELMKVSLLGTVTVMTKCHELNQNWARITQVDKGFSEEDICSALKQQGVVSVRREMTKRKIGGELIAMSTDRVLLKFEGLPPEEVAFGYRTYKVTLHAGSPTSCFRCQKIGHRASECKSPVTCIRCGRQDGHLAASCKNALRCVNCRGPHAASSMNCPLRVIAIEKRKVFMENRVYQQIKASHTNVNVETTPTLAKSGSNDANSTATQQTEEPTQKTWASVARTIVADTAEGDKIKVNLPGPTTFPKEKKNATKPQPSTGRKKKTLLKKKNQNLMPIRGLGNTVKILSVICPQAAKSLRELVSLLTPLVNLVSSLQPTNKRMARNTHNKKT